MIFPIIPHFVKYSEKILHLSGVVECTHLFVGLTNDSASAIAAPIAVECASKFDFIPCCGKLFSLECPDLVPSQRYAQRDENAERNLKKTLDSNVPNWARAWNQHDDCDSDAS